MFRIIGAGIVLVTLTRIAVSQPSPDQTKQDNFLFNLLVVMKLEERCPSLQLNKDAVRRKAAEAGIDLSKGLSPQQYPGLFKDSLKAVAFITMMNDAGGAYPCDRILSFDRKAGSEKGMEWEQFIQ